MDLILWRHADAEEGFPDEARELTEKGEKQAARIAAWLRPRLPREVRILASPAKRAQQTAAALGKAFETTAKIGPGAPASSLLAIADWPGAKGAVVIVGHQPTLGRAAALLLSGAEMDWSVKKGGIWWFSNRAHQDEPQTVLCAVMTPELCGVKSHHE